MLTSNDIKILLNMLREKYGFGYSEIQEIGLLQAKLSIMLEMQNRNESVE